MYILTCYCECVYDYECSEHNTSFHVYVSFYLTRSNIDTDWLVDEVETNTNLRVKLFTRQLPCAAMRETDSRGGHKETHKRLSSSDENFPTYCKPRSEDGSYSFSNSIVTDAESILVFRGTSNKDHNVNSVLVFQRDAMEYTWYA